MAGDLQCGGRIGGLENVVVRVVGEPHSDFYGSCGRISWLQKPVQARLTAHSTRRQ